MSNQSKLAFGVEPSHRFYRLRLARYQALADTLMEYLKEHNHNPLCLLDVGVGKGRTLMYLEKAGAPLEKLDLHGLDLHDRRLESVYKKENWNLVKGDVQEGIPFEDEKFDVVICEQILEHLEKPEEVLREMARVLKKGGLLIVGVPIFSPVIYHLRNVVQPIYDRLRGIERGHIQSFSLRKIKKLVKHDNLFAIEHARGFRIASGGVISFLEDFAWWWKLNRFVGKLLPTFTTEVQVISRKVNHPA